MRFSNDEEREFRRARVDALDCACQSSDAVSGAGVQPKPQNYVKDSSFWVNCSSV